MSLPLVVMLAASVAAGAELPPRGRDVFGKRTEQAAKPKATSTNLWGEVHLSNKKVFVGWLSLSYGRRLELYDVEAKKWRKLHLSELVRMDASIRSEEFEREWRWKEGGSDEKVYTGRGYPRRWLNHSCRLTTKESFTGHLNGAVLHVTVPEKKKPERSTTEAAPTTGAKKTEKKSGPTKMKLILRQYERGKLGTTLDDLVYVKSIVVIGKPPAEGAPPTSR